MARLGSKSKIELYVADRVKAFRINLNLSQAELANRLDVSIGFVGHVESPKTTTKYNLNHINKLAEIFKCSPKDFLPEAPYNTLE